MSGHIDLRTLLSLEGRTAIVTGSQVVVDGGVLLS